MDQILIFNGYRFSKLTQNAVCECHGFYKKSRVGISLYKPTGELEAFIVNNSHQGYFVVTASTRNGQPFYMHSTCSLTEKWLGLENMGLMATSDAILAIQFVNDEDALACAA